MPRKEKRRTGPQLPAAPAATRTAAPEPAGSPGPTLPAAAPPDPPGAGLALALPAGARRPVQIAAALLALVLLQACWHALLPFAVALVAAYALRTPVDALTPRLGAPLAICTVFLALAAVFMLLIIPIVANVVAEVATLPAKAARYRDATVRLVRDAASGSLPAPGATGEVHLRLLAGVRRLLIEHPEVHEKIQAAGTGFLKAAGSTLLTLVQRVGGFFAQAAHLFIVPYLVFLLLLDWPRLAAWARGRLAGNPDLLALALEADAFLGSFLRGQLTCAFLVGVMLSVGLYAIGVDFAFIIGPLAGFFNLVPYLGPLVATVPSCLLALLKSGLTTETLVALVLVGLLQAAVQAIDGFVLQPLFLGASVDMHPLELLLALFVGADLGGIWGMLLAIPLYGTLRIVGRRVRVVFA